MIIACPSCSDTFDVSENQLSARAGANVQCPRCSRLVAVRDTSFGAPSPDATIPFDSGTRAPSDDIRTNAQLLILDGPGQGEIFRLTKPITTLGGPKGRADIKLPDGEVADTHATIEWDKIEFRVRVVAPNDLAIGGKQVADARLRGQSVFKVGKTKLMLTVTA